MTQALAGLRVIDMTHNGVAPEDVQRMKTEGIV
jgi:hypothetical protein